MYDRRYCGALVVGCSGVEMAEIKQTYFGEMRSRSGASLQYTEADANLVFKEWSREENILEGASEILIEPTVTEFASAIKKISHELSELPQSDTGIDIYFAGHGLPGNGALVLRDGEVSAFDLISLIKQYMKSGDGIRGLSMLLDSCYSGAFLFEAMVALQEDRDLQLYDCLCSSMHDEKSWELSFLEHGAFTFTHFHKGNHHVDNLELAIAIDKCDYKIIAKCIQGLVGMMADPTTFLTQGRQHPVDCIKGLFLEAGTRGSIGNWDEKMPFTKQQIIQYLEKSIK